MDLSHSFEVGQPIDRTWSVLTDIEQVAACVPGAELREVSGLEFRGVIHAKIGPITTEYAGEAVVVGQNHADRKVVVNGQGLDADGEGRAEATLTARLEAVSDTRTQVNIDTDITLTGRVAQLGRGVISEVGDALVAQFADNLDAHMSNGGGVASTARPLRRTVEMPAPEAIDLMDAARTPLLKRLAGLGLAAVVLALVVRRFRR